MPKITELYAFIAEDDGPNDEGVIAAEAHGYWFPLVGADIDRVFSWIPVADEISKQTGCKYKILQFKLIGEIKVQK